MFSNYCSIKLKFNYFYIFFYHYWYLELQLNRYKVLLFLRLFIHKVYLFGVLVIIFVLIIVNQFFYIDMIRFHWSWNLSLGVISNCLWDISKPDIWIYFTHRFVEGRDKGYGWVFRLVRFNLLILLISNLLQVIFQALFRWLLNCVCHIYWIHVHWSWNVSSGVIENFQWGVSKPYIRICFYCRFVEGHGEGAGFRDFTCIHQYIDFIQGSSSTYSSLKLLSQV